MPGAGQDGGSRGAEARRSRAARTPRLRDTGETVSTSPGPWPFWPRCANSGLHSNEDRDPAEVLQFCFQGEGTWSAELVSQTPIRASRRREGTHDDGIQAGLLTQ